MRAEFHSRIDTLPAAAWNALAPPGFPFLRHEFLAAMERHGCVGEHYGWIPHHLAMWEDQQLAGVAPLYIKTNSYGEFVFDWAWADAYARRGMRYYPKLVAAIPYTPVTGQRLLARDTATRVQMIAAVHSELARLNFSSMHWLFPPVDENALLCAQNALPRRDVQFHWRNAGYADFAQFLQALSAKKRKNIQRERRLVSTADVHIERLRGDAATPQQWEAFHLFYRHTFDTKGGMPTFSVEFFQDIARTMGEQLLLVLASHAGRWVAGALSYVGADGLYGRHWGALEHFDSLHFELCYYQGIEFAIAQGLAVFEPGAQGEHKIARGFLPVVTHSAHLLTDPTMHGAVARYLAQETESIGDYVAQCLEHSPYRAIE